MVNVPTSRLTVKICGVRRLEDALVVAKAGADYVGMVFVPGRRRRVDPADARTITDGLRAYGADRPATVGLFGDQPLEEVLETADVAGLEYAQLCGDEPLGYCRQVNDHARVIKVLHVPGDCDDATLRHLDRQIAAYSDVGCTVTLDSQVAGLHGGTGQSFDWRVASTLAEHRDFLLAGGLTPENVADAVVSVRPWGVDVSSGVETDGEKDPYKIVQFVTNARGTTQ